MNNLATTHHDELAVLKLHDEVLASFNTLDLERLLSLHTENIILMEPNMPIIKGKQEIRKLFHEFENQKIVLKLSYTIQELEIFGDRAFVRGQVMKTTIQNDKRIIHDTGKFITLSQKQIDGAWLRTHVIVNSDMPVEVNQPSSRVPISMGIRDRLWKN